MAMTLRAARVNVGLKQTEAAEAIGVTQNTIYRWENGISMPNLKHIPNICKTYKLNSYDDIIFLPTNNA